MHLRQHQVYRGLRWRMERGAKKLFEETVAKNFPYLEKEINIGVLEAWSPKDTT